MAQVARQKMAFRASSDYFFLRSKDGYFVAGRDCLYRVERHGSQNRDTRRTFLPQQDGYFTMGKYSWRGLRPHPSGIPRQRSLHHGSRFRLPSGCWNGAADFEEISEDVVKESISKDLRPKAPQRRGDTGSSMRVRGENRWGRASGGPWTSPKRFHTERDVP